MTNSFVLIGLPRTGTSILLELLEQQFNCDNFDEDWSIDGLTDTSKIDIRLLRKDTEFNSKIIFNEVQNRLSFLVNRNQKNWIIKSWPEFCLSHKNLIDKMYASNVRIFMTHRRNIEEHFTSWVNAMYRSTMNGNKHYNYFNLNVNSHHLMDREYEIFIPENVFDSFFEYYCNCLLRWRLTYEIFKDKITLLSFEDQITQMRLENIGITKDTIKKYHQKEKHLIPTPYNSKRFLQKNLVSNYKLILKNYQYLVEI